MMAHQAVYKEMVILKDGKATFCDISQASMEERIEKKIIQDSQCAICVFLKLICCEKACLQMLSKRGHNTAMRNSSSRRGDSSRTGPRHGLELAPAGFDRLYVTLSADE